MKFSTYVKCLKKYAKNKKISDEAFVNAVLKPYIDAGEVDNKKGEELILDKSRVSLLMNSKRVENVSVLYPNIRMDRTKL